MNTRESTIIVAALPLIAVAMSVVALNSQRKQPSLCSPKWRRWARRGADWEFRWGLRR